MITCSQKIRFYDCSGFFNWRARWQGGLIIDKSLRTACHKNKYGLQGIYTLNLWPHQHQGGSLDWFGRPWLLVTCPSRWGKNPMWHVTLCSHIVGWRGIWFYWVIFLLTWHLHVEYDMESVFANVECNYNMSYFGSECRPCRMWLVVIFLGDVEYDYVESYLGRCGSPSGML